MVKPKPERIIEENCSPGTNIPERFLKDDYSGPISCTECRWNGDFSSLNLIGAREVYSNDERTRPHTKRFLDAICPLCSNDEFEYDPEYYEGVKPVPMMIHPGVYLPTPNGQFPEAWT